MRRPRKPVPPNTVTVRPFVATTTQIRLFMSELLTACGEGPIRAIEQPINLARHDEVVLMQSFDLLGAQRDSSIAPAEADVRVMAFSASSPTSTKKPIRWTTLAPIGQRSFFRVCAARRLVSITTLPVRTFCGMLKSGLGEGDNRRLSNGEQINRLAALSLKRGKSVDFGGYWQRHSKDVHARAKASHPRRSV
jgi:hypothetical protein